jgi:hypothetical protein
MAGQFCLRLRLPHKSQGFLRAAELRHRANGVTSLPKEGMLRIFSPEKIRRLQPGLKPHTLVLHHQSRCPVPISHLPIEQKTVWPTQTPDGLTKMSCLWAVSRLPAPDNEQQYTHIEQGHAETD